MGGETLWLGGSLASICQYSLFYLGIQRRGRFCVAYIDFGDFRGAESLLHTYVSAPGRAVSPPVTMLASRPSMTTVYPPWLSIPQVGRQLYRARDEDRHNRLGRRSSMVFDAIRNPSWPQAPPQPDASMIDQCDP